MVKAGKNESGKDVFNVYRVHDAVLSQYLRNAQDNGKCIVSVIPLFRQKMKDVVGRYIFDNESTERISDISETYLRKDIDPRLLKTVGYVRQPIFNNDGEDDSRL